MRKPEFRGACRDFVTTRRSILRAGIGMGGLSLPQILCAQKEARAASEPTAGFGRAKSCIVFFSWGGVSQLETWDPKPDAPAEIRGDYRPIATATPGTFVGEYMPLLSQQTERLAIIRSIHHKEAGHRNAAYWNLTGHEPHTPGIDEPIMPSRKDWPCLGSMVAKFRHAPAKLPGTVCIPYSIADRGLLNGQYGGFMGMHSDPLTVKPDSGKLYAGISPASGTADLGLPEGTDLNRMQGRRNLVKEVGPPAVAPASSSERNFDYYREMAYDLVLNPQVSAAFDLKHEPARLRESYGDHICGQSALLARRLTDAGVPLVMVYSSVGDLNGSSGHNWDTHGNNFPRLRDELLPPLERSSTALLNDLASTGRLDETLVVWLTEFGRTPQINFRAGAGRDHYPNVYSVALAGAGVRGGQIYGRSDAHAAYPADRACGPADLHATIFHALGIPVESQIEDSFGRPMPLSNGEVLPLF